mmetsp:Transcript_69007/g.156088  ORF Transcript_69007/g.156088 Transcript_69007/m.156088 type:complete len:211 (+) Transcript_69007:662-1294(+)
MSSISRGGMCSPNSLASFSVLRRSLLDTLGMGAAAALRSASVGSRKGSSLASDWPRPSAALTSKSDNAPTCELKVRECGVCAYKYTTRCKGYHKSSPSIFSLSLSLCHTKYFIRPLLSFFLFFFLRKTGCRAKPHPVPPPKEAEEPPPLFGVALPGAHQDQVERTQHLFSSPNRGRLAVGVSGPRHVGESAGRRVTHVTRHRPDSRRRSL